MPEITYIFRQRLEENGKKIYLFFFFFGKKEDFMTDPFYSLIR